MEKILNVSSKLGFCGMPIRADTGSGCSHQCVYCFSNNRCIRKRKNEFISKKGQLKKEVDNSGGILKELLDNKIPLHWGGLSDPFYSTKIGELTTSLQTEIPDYPILYSTKGISFDEDRLDRETKAFQFSICMNDADAKQLEPFAPPPSERIKKAKKLIKKGFWVAVRIQPYIPIISDKVIDLINSVNWNYVVIEGIKIVPQLPEKEKVLLLTLLGLKREDFFQFGLLNLRVGVRAKFYLNLLEKLNDYPIGMADNDLHFLSDSSVCCGTDTIPNWNFYTATTTALSRTKEFIGLKDLYEEWLPSGDIKDLFTSNRVEKDFTNLFGENKPRNLRDYFESRFYKKGSSFSPSIFFGFTRVLDKYMNPYWEQGRLEVLAKIMNKDNLIEKGG